MDTSRKYLTGPQILQRYGISDMTLHRWLRNPALGFPRPIYIGKRRYFSEEELIKFERSRVGCAK